MKFVSRGLLVDNGSELPTNVSVKGFRSSEVPSSS